LGLDTKQEDYTCVCCNGDQQAHGINYLAPKVFWATVRILLILSVLVGRLNLCSS